MNPGLALQYARGYHRRFVSQLKEFLRFPSVSSQPARTEDSRQCATWLARHLQQIGLERVRVIPTRGNPIVYASWTNAGKCRPTVLIYGHYDVLPGEPRAGWQTPPFAPTIKGQDIYARGAADDKGQLFCHVKAIECWLRGAGKLPVNLKCLFEGEEEIGSTHLLPFVQRNQHTLAADAAVISDTKMLAPGTPAISYAQRGGLRAEIEVRGPEQDLHSGTFGGAVLNPLQALCEIIARLHDDSGRVALPGFYDDVRDWGNDERAYMARVGPSDGKLLEDGKVEQGWGEPGYSLYERTTIRPALTLNGIIGGYNGPGVKGVVPTHATAKLSFRLVPDQDPAGVGKVFREFVARVAAEAVRVSTRTFAPVQPALIDRQHPAVRAAALAYKKGFGAYPVFLRSGGSIPIVNTVQKMLGMPAVLMGFGLPDDRIHAPNEKFHLPNLYRGIETSIWYLSIAARVLAHQNRAGQFEEQKAAV